MAQRNCRDCTNSKYKQVVLPDGSYSDSTMSESDYMALSEKWKRLRENAFKRDGQKCVMCGAAYPLEVHHRRYPKAWGAETLDDLVTLCDDCHKKLHEEKKRRL